MGPRNSNLQTLGRRLALGIGTILFLVYGAVTIVISTVIAWRSDDARQDPGLIGSVVTGKPSAARAYLWPYFVLTGRPIFATVNTTKSELNRILPAIKAASAYNRKMEEIRVNGGRPSADQMRDLIRARDTILAVEPIDTVLLNEVYPEFGTMLETKLFAAITLVMDPTRADRETVTAESNHLVREWNDWYGPRLGEVYARIQRITR